MDSPPPPLQSLLNTSLPVRTYGWAYTEVITKFSRMDRFPISVSSISNLEMEQLWGTLEQDCL